MWYMKTRALAFSLVVLIMVFLLPCRSFATEEDLPLVEKVFNERNGLPTGEANDVIQTKDGYIWIGSYGGLIRYDGQNFRNFSTEGILPSSSVRMLFEDSMGRLWIGTNDAGVFVMEDDVISSPQGQPDDSFLCVRGFAEGNGVIYAGSSSGVAEIKDGVMSVYTDPAIAGQTIYSIGVDPYGRLWCAGSNDGCTIIRDGNVISQLSSDKLFGNGESVYSVASETDGTIWVGGSGNHILRLEFSGEDLDGDISCSEITLGSVSIINSIRQTSDGAIAVSGLHGFAEIREGKVIREISEEEGAVEVNSSCIDYEGNIWLASTGLGVVYLSEGCFEAVAGEALEGLNLNAVALSGDRIYAGVNSGIIITNSRGDGSLSDSEKELVEMLDGSRVRDIIADSRGRVWVASYSDFPVVCYDTGNGSITSFTENDGLSGNKARTLLETSDGDIAVGLQSGVCIISDGRVSECYSELQYPAVLSLTETSQGTIFAGSDGGGIYELTGGEVITHSFDEGLGEGVVLRMLKDGDTGNYFVSAGSSLYYYYYDEKRFEKLSALKKEAGSIFDFYLKDGRLWLIQNSGIVSVDRDSLLSGGDGDPVTYGFGYGLTGSTNANTRHCLNDGRLYISTRNGACVFGFKVPAGSAPKSIINSVTVDGTVYEHPEKLTLEGDVNRITIDFAALSFSETSRFTVAYELIGFDRSEQVIEGRNVSYTNLPGGEYEFRLRIFSPDGSETVCSFTIVKKMLLTERLIFKVGIVVLAIAVTAAGAMLIYGARLRNAASRQREYKQIIQQALQTFADIIDAKDKYTSGHSTRVAMYSKELARRMGFSEEKQEHIYNVALLHDIGKIGVPDDILNKPGRLTDEERNIIQMHPKTGAQILENFTALEGICDGARYHHERYDGKGYCEGRAGEDIPLTARIIGVADTYDAMSSERCYRKALSREVIESELREAAGTQLDPQIVPHMLEMIEDGTAPITGQDGKGWHNVS